MINGALDNIKVLDLGQDISAPYCAKLLADYGAEVIKVEPHGQGDSARRMGPFPGDIPNPEKSGLFLHLNMNKKGVTLNLHTREGVKILKELVKGADILVENYAPAHLPSLGLGYEDLEQVNPRLVMTSITPFGQTGLYRDYKATEMGVFAMSGRMYTHGLPEREPLRYAPDISWFQTGTTAAISTLAALGQQVVVSAMEAVVGSMDYRVLLYEYTGVKSRRGDFPSGFPQGAYPCQDGYVTFGVGQQRFFQRLCQAMGRTDLSEDPRFATSDARTENLDELEAIFLGWMMEHTKREIFEICQKVRVPCSPLLGPDELLDDPQLKAREFFVEADHPQAGRLTYPGAPFRMTQTPFWVRSPAPLLGQHNTEIYSGGLGYSKD
ncbi:MAG: CoA transferase, partial [Dehalococcoidia bacterium]|nr:CoA transferase [Dehalococcoidia bacterium]